MLLFGSGSSVITHNYDGPTLLTMRERLARALRDEEKQSFHDPDLNDYIAAAMVEVSRIYPKEVIETFDLSEGDVREWSVGFDTIWRVEVLRDDVFQMQLDRGDGDLSHGWDMYAGTLLLPDWFDFNEDTDALRVFGYVPRDAASVDDDVLDVDAEAEQAVRQFAMLEGYQALLNDRSLFTQWNALPGNSDVTMNQINALARSYQDKWETTRKHLKRLRRS